MNFRFPSYPLKLFPSPSVWKFIFLVFFLSPFSPNLVGESWEQTRGVLTMGTGSYSGIYYPLGKSLSEYLRDRYQNYLLVTPTEGSGQNLQFLIENKFQIGMIQSDVLYHKNLESPLELSGLKTLMSLYSEHLYLVFRADLPIQKIEDFENRGISFGSHDSGTFNLLKSLFPRLGINLENTRATFDNLSHSIQKLKEGTIDGFFFVGGENIPALAALGNEIPITFFSFPFEWIDSTLKDLPFLTSGVLHPNYYPFLKTPVSTLSVRALLLAQANLDEKTAYLMVKTIHEEKSNIGGNIAPLKNAPAALYTSGTCLNFHPGAIIFFLEIGIPVRVFGLDPVLLH